tara:strand:+ start:5159 stop:6475 length:1317 start_codon:yes stop_codon:yes gene_type:complete
MSSVQANIKCPASAQPQKRKTVGIPRTNSAYWRDRVEKVTCRNGDESPCYSVRIVYQKKRVRFPLDTANKEAAASKSAKIFQFLIENGWEDTLEEFKPQTVGKEAKLYKGDTVGALIEAASRLSTARPQSKDAYTKAFRRVVAGVMRIEDGKKFDGLKGGTKAWQAAVDAVQLSEITPAKVTGWKNLYLEDANQNGSKFQSAKTTVNSLIRNAKALFSRKLLPFLEKEIKLPDPLPFEQVAMEKSASMRYHSKIDATAIIQAAMGELRDSDPEVLKVLTLACICGLRISEIDYLLWDAFDLDRGVLRVETTEYHELKSADSSGEIDLNEQMVALFRDFRADSAGDFVVESERSTTKRPGSRHYRCDSVFVRLRNWLRWKGVKAKKPIHELRKEVGSIIASEHGIFEASRYLRHSDIRITAAIYVDKKQRITPSLKLDV